MKKPVKKLNFDDLIDVCNEMDRSKVFDKINIIPDDSDLRKELKKAVDSSKFNRKAVLGIDIYKYSSFSDFEQTMIPFLYKILFEATIEKCFKHHAYLFQHYKREEILNDFISTGDGGFLFFDTPLHALVFATNFATVLRTYNSFHVYPKLRKIIGGISVRYAITYGKVYLFDNKYYGRAIINNARTLQKDDLNRCLIDESTYTWFTINLDGIENLQILTLKDVANVYDFQNKYDEKLIEEGDSLFGKVTSRYEGIINSDILKIGTINSKETKINIYNLHIQSCMRFSNPEDPKEHKIITISLGNLNTQGI